MTTVSFVLFPGLAVGSQIEKGGGGGGGLAFIKRQTVLLSTAELNTQHDTPPP